MKLEDLLTNKNFTRNFFRKTLLLITLILLVVFCLFKSEIISAGLGTFFNAFKPFLLGICVAYVLNILVKLFENKVFAVFSRKGYPWWKRHGRIVCVFVSIGAVFALFACVLLFIIPELISSLKMLTDNVPMYVQSATQWLTKKLTEFHITTSQIKLLKVDWSNLMTKATQMTTDFLGNIYNFTITFASGVFTFGMSMIFSIYMLSNKEKLIRSMRRVLYAFLPKKIAHNVIELSAITNKIFSGFVAGQLTESLIIGILCYIGMMILQLPYALLISSVLCVCTLLPLFGAYIGAFIGCMILLLIKPIYCVWFLIFLMCLQQFEGNVIYPRVVGTSIGLPGMWVLLSVLMFGGLFGVPGILIGIPLASVFYALFTQLVSRKLKLRQISEETVCEQIDVNKILHVKTGSPLKGLSNKISKAASCVKNKAASAKKDSGDK